MSGLNVASLNVSTPSTLTPTRRSVLGDSTGTLSAEGFKADVIACAARAGGVDPRQLAILDIRESSAATVLGEDPGYYDGDGGDNDVAVIVLELQQPYNLTRFELTVVDAFDEYVLPCLCESQVPPAVLSSCREGTVSADASEDASATIAELVVSSTVVPAVVLSALGCAVFVSRRRRRREDEKGEQCDDGILLADLGSDARLATPQLTNVATNLEVNPIMMCSPADSSPPASPACLVGTETRAQSCHSNPLWAAGTADCDVDDAALLPDDSQEVFALMDHLLDLADEGSGAEMVTELEQEMMCETTAAACEETTVQTEDLSLVELIITSAEEICTAHEGVAVTTADATDGFGLPHLSKSLSLLQQRLVLLGDDEMGSRALAQIQDAVVACGSVETLAYDALKEGSSETPAVVRVAQRVDSVKAMFHSLPTPKGLEMHVSAVLRNLELTRQGCVRKVLHAANGNQHMEASDLLTNVMAQLQPVQQQDSTEETDTLDVIKAAIQGLRHVCRRSIGDSTLLRDISEQYARRKGLGSVRAQADDHEWFIEQGPLDLS